MKMLTASFRRARWSAAFAFGIAVWGPAAHGGPPGAVPVAAPFAKADFGAAPAQADARMLAGWVMATGDHDGGPFAVIDKRAATLYVFAPSGQLLGASPVLLGLAAGDDNVPGIGNRPILEVKPHERTTPAGRFVTSTGVSLGGESVVWVDYDAAVSMHSVRATVASERRLERLASPDPAQRRISYGCINVPAAFFAKVAMPAFAERGVVYVLPETRPLATEFAALREAARQAAPVQHALLPSAR